MEPVTIAIAGVTLVVGAALAYAIKQYLEIRRKNKEIEALRRSLNAYAETYALEDADEVLVAKCKAKIKELFNGDIEKEFGKHKTIEAKKAFARKVTMELAKCMNVQLDRVEIGSLGLYIYGMATPSHKPVTIYLNEILLIANPVQLVKTICHELKHCVQYQSLTDNVWGYSAERIAQYLYSWEHYTTCHSEECYEAYYKQIIEIDANKYVDRIFNA